MRASRGTSEARSGGAADRRRHVKGLLRAFAYLWLVAGVCAFLSVRSARAEVKESTLAIGRQMLELARAANAEDHAVTPIRFNGERMYLASAVSEDAPKTVLDRYGEHCAAHPAMPMSGWPALAGDARSPDAPAAQGPPGTNAVLRAGDGVEGSVVCFVRGAATKANATEAFQSFAETGELGYIGKLRLAYAKRDVRSGRTLILTVWTDDQFNLKRLLPSGGEDVPGEDFAELPRVPNASRALSAVAEGMPYGLNVYRTKDAPSKVVAFYDEHMSARGFAGFDPELDPGEGAGRTYTKDGVVLTVAARREPEATFVVLGLAGVSSPE